MVAAAATIWLMFAFWIVGPYLGLPRAAARVAAVLLSAELVLLLTASYGTTPLAQAIGVAARVDVPVLAGVFVALVIGRELRRGAA